MLAYIADVTVMFQSSSTSVTEPDPSSTTVDITLELEMPVGGMLEADVTAFVSTVDGSASMCESTNYIKFFLQLDEKILHIIVI